MSPETRIAGIRNTVYSGVKVASDNIFKAAGFDTYSIEPSDLPILSRTYDDVIKTRVLVHELSKQYDKIILPSYTKLISTNPDRVSSDIIPFVHQFHRVSYSPSSLIGKINIKLSVRNLEICSDVVVCSSTVKSHLIEETSLDENNVHTVRWGVDTNTFYPDMSTEFGIPDKFILYVGSFLERKNTKFLVDVLDKLPDYNLVTAGYCCSEEKRQEFKRYAREKNALNRIHMKGYLPNVADLRKLYSSASVYLHPAKFEGYGLAPLEAAACGTVPVLYERLPVAHDLQETGKVFADFNPERVAGMIEQVDGKIDFAPRTWEQSADMLLRKIN
jgi:glycosyltransferase involved in cell wall biosynthesis